MRKLIVILIVLAGCGADALPPCPNKPCPCTRAGVCTCDGATCQRDLGKFDHDASPCADGAGGCPGEDAP